MSEDLFEKLEPPPGGLTRLRARLEDEPRRLRERQLRLAGLCASALAVVAIAGVQVRKAERRQALQMFGPALLEKAGLTRAAPVRPRGDAAAELASAKGEVIFYRVDSVQIPSEPR